MKLSIITINYNNARGLETTLASLPWGLDDFESIVVDGGSSDDSLDVAQSYVERGARLISEPDEGVYDALNKGIRLAKGEFLSFMNSGDSFETGVLPPVLDELTGKAVFYGDRYVGPKRGLTKYPKQFRVHHMFTGLRGLCHQTMFVPRLLFEEIGLYDDSMLIVADWCWNLEALMRPDVPFVHLERVVCHYEGGGVSSAESPLHAKGDEEKLGFLKRQYPDVYEDWLDYARLLQEESKRRSSGIYRWADRIFDWKNSRRG